MCCLRVPPQDIDHLVNTFITAEDQNYTLFNYVNEVNQEIEKLEDQITAIKAETDKCVAGEKPGACTRARTWAGS